jgi:hypothetical protein
MAYDWTQAPKISRTRSGLWKLKTYTIVGWTEVLDENRSIIEKIADCITARHALPLPDQPPRYQPKKWYELEARPIDIGTIPKDPAKLDFEWINERGFKFGRVQYDRELTPEEIEHYDLKAIAI